MMPQFARPIEDLYLRIPQAEEPDQDSWRTDEELQTNLYQRIRQTIPNDADFAESNLILGPVLPDSSDAYVVKLSLVEDIIIDEGLVVRVRLSKDVEDGNKVSCLVELREEYENEGAAEEGGGDLGLLRGSATFEDISETPTEYSFEIDPELAASIQDFENLSLRFVFTSEYNAEVV